MLAQKEYIQTKSGKKKNCVQIQRAHFCTEGHKYFLCLASSLGRILKHKRIVYVEKEGQRKL